MKWESACCAPPSPYAQSMIHSAGSLMNRWILASMGMFAIAYPRSLFYLTHPTAKIIFALHIRLRPTKTGRQRNSHINISSPSRRVPHATSLTATTMIDENNCNEESTGNNTKESIRGASVDTTNQGTTSWDQISHLNVSSPSIFPFPSANEHPREIR